MGAATTIANAHAAGDLNRLHVFVSILASRVAV
jgi:hypothetical protein